MGIVGLTDHFLHERIGLEEYEDSLLMLRPEVSRLNFEADELVRGLSWCVHRRSCSYLDELQGEDESRQYVAMRIESIIDLRFVLYRHWNLYDRCADAERGAREWLSHTCAQHDA
jgi:hypothetical protein